MQKKEETGITFIDDVTVYFQLYRVFDLWGKTNEPNTVSVSWTKAIDEVNTKIALGYYILKDKKQARKFVDKALVLNAKNETALKLKESLQ